MAPPHRPELCIAQVMRGSRPVGLAFPVVGGHLVTCAHVVNTVLDRPVRDSSVPDRSAVVRVRFPLSHDRDPTRRATVRAWLPGGDRAFELSDAALLAVEPDLPADVAPLRLAAGDPTGPAQLWGPAPNRPTGGHVTGRLLGLVDEGRWHLDQDLGGAFRARPGFSGGPVWRPTTGEVVGMLQASSVDDDAPDAYVLGTEPLARLLATVAGPAGPAGPAAPAAAAERDRTTPAAATLTGSPLTAAVPLPPYAAHFTGREAELSRLRSYLADGDARTGVICVVSGMAGVGKTALALRIAHELTERFPDTQLYVNLHGYHPTLRLTPTEVLDRFLRQLGVGGAALPSSLDEQIGLYRSLLADKRALVVLDNAVTAGQVRDLLPGSPGSLVLVTSRHRLAGLVAGEGARLLIVGGLTPADALTLLARVVGSDRIEGDPPAAEEIARLCRYVPLALRIAAAKLVARPELALRDFATRLGDEERLLEELAVDDVEIRATLAMSYHELGPDAARLFRYLGLFVGPDFGVEVAAALVGRGEVAGLVELLVDAHLLEPSGSPGRYRMHDLVRAFARERVAAEESDDAQAGARRRMLRWFLDHAGAAERPLSPGRHRWWGDPAGDAGSGTGYDYLAGLQWFETERQNLVAACGVAADLGLDEFAWRLADVCWSYFQLRKYWTDWEATHRCGLAAARRAGNRRAEAWMLTGLGGAQWELGRFEEAVGHLLEALTLHRALDDPHGQSRTLNNLGFAYHYLGRFDDAIACCERALALCRAVGDSYREGWVLYNLGKSYAGLRRYQRAIGCCTEALAIWRDTGHRVGLGFTLDHLGSIYIDLGRYDEAIDHLRQALMIRQEAGDRYGEGLTLNNLGVAYERKGRAAEGGRYRRLALDILTELHAPEAAAIRAGMES